MNLKTTGLTATLRSISTPVITACVLLCHCLPILGNTWVWTGGGAPNGDWNNAANWGSAGIPANGDTVVFQGTIGLNSTNNIANLTLSQIRFIDTGFNLYGDAFTVTNSIVATNFTGTAVINPGFTIATANVTMLVSNGITLTLNENISGNVGVTKSGAGTLTYQGPGDNTYSGTTLVAQGTLQLNVAGYFAVAGPLVIGTGTGISAEVTYLQMDELQNLPSLTVNSDGILNLNGNGEAYFTPTITLIGQITTGGGTLNFPTNTTITLANNDEAVIFGNLNLNGGTLTIQGSGYLDVDANVSGTANIVQSSALGTLWGGGNSYGGSYTVNGSGYVEPFNSQAFGATSNAITLNGTAYVDVPNAINITNQSLTLNSTFVAQIYCQGIATWQANFINNAGLTVDVSSGASLNLIGPISGAGALTKIDTGTLTLSGATANTYGGTTTASDGTLLLGKGFAIPAVPGPLVIDSGAVVQLLNHFQINNFSTSVTMGDSSVFDLAGFTDAVGPLTMQGAQINGAGFLYLGGNITVNVSTVAQSVISGGASIFGSIITITNTGHNFAPDLLISANLISGGATNGLIKTGNGSVSLAGNNSFTGPITINGGNLWAPTSAALGNTNAPLTVNSNGCLYLPGGTLDFGAKPLFLDGPGSFNEPGAINAISGSSSFEGPITINGDTTFYRNPATSLTLAGTINGTGNLTFAGPGTNTLSGSGDNNYVGTTLLAGGTMNLSKTGAYAIGFGTFTIGTGTGSAASVVAREYGSYEIDDVSVIINSDGLLDLNGNSDVIGPAVTLTGPANILNTSAGTLNLVNGTTLSVISGNSSIAGNLNVGDTNTTCIWSNGGILSMTASVSGSATIDNTGTGNTFLTTANSYFGPTVVQQGFLWAQNSLALGATNSSVIVSNGASLVLDRGIGITNKPLFLNGQGVGGIGDYGSLDVEGYTNYWVGPITVNANSTLDAWSSGSQLHINGPISGPGGLDLFGDTSGGGTQFYEGSAANSYGGLTTVDPGGTLELNKSIFGSTVPGNLAVSGSLICGNSDQINNGADVSVNSGGVFAFGPYYQAINTLHGTGSVTFGTDGYLEIGQVGGSSEFDGTMSGTGFVGGYTVGKLGSGTFTLTGTNTYLNETRVFGGTLVVNGSQLQSPAIVDNGAILGGSGIVGSITADGAISPGDGGPGVLTCSNLTFTSTGSYVVQLTGPAPGSGYDQINPLILIGSNFLANAALQIVPNFTSPVSIGQQFTIISNATPNLFNGTFNGLPEGTLITAGGYTFRISYVGGTGNDVVLTLLGIPGNTVTVNAADTGWYDSTGLHNSGNSNYFAGHETSVTTDLYRNFFVFTIPVSSAPIVHAELFVNNYTDVDTNGQETYVLRKVTIPIATLEAGGSGLTGIYTNLGTNAVYSVRSVATNESGQNSIIILNAQFMNDAMAASGNQLAMGGTVEEANPTNNQIAYLFAASGHSPDDVQLRLTYGTNIVISSANRGWYDKAGAHTAGNLNYIVGDDAADIFRNYFVFDVPAISGQLVGAQLLLNGYGINSSNLAEMYQLYDVTSSIPVLESTQTTATNIYNDLGSGLVYGGRDVYTSESGQIATIPLNGNFLTAVQTNGSGPFALGGAVTTLAPFPALQDMFSGSGGGPSDAQLWLGFYIAPISNTTFTGNTPAYLGNGRYQFTLSGASNSTNEIQASFDFQRWDYITDVKLSGTTGSFTYTNNAPVPYRFFRAEPLQ